MNKKYVYDFNEGNKEMKSLLGGKGANLAEMTGLGLTVPPGFTITTQACNRYFDENNLLWQELLDEVQVHIDSMGKKLNKTFSDENDPLLVSVRSGAVFSMPGMMDTILNLGLNDKAVVGLSKSTGNERFAYDSYRRFIEMFSNVAMEIPRVHFDNALENIKKDREAELDSDLSADDLKELVEIYKNIFKEEMGYDFPQEPLSQLKYSIESVFRSWNNPRAEIYRRLHNIDVSLGTAVNVQSMVFGNMGNTSGTGVAFSRNPATGENELFGEFLINAQGEDVVAGIRTPEHISDLKNLMPAVYNEFYETAKKLENHYKDMQDLEFTIENGKLYLLQTRNGKRTTQAALNIVVDLVEEGLITKDEAIMRIDPDSLNQLLHPDFDKEQLEKARLLAKGLAASPGASSGKIYFHANEAVDASKKGEKVILVRQETSPEDIEGMVLAEGILTARGGMTSHAAVVARGMGKCCVAGASEIVVDEAQRILRTHDLILKEGDIISLNGSDGSIYLGNIDKVEPELSGNFDIFMKWADEIRDMEVRTNADSPKDAKQALEFGAEGIGLTRTEHMFFSEDRISAVREMILSKSLEQRVHALNKIRPMQEKDFYEIYDVMEDRPVTIRLLDPPLHEFLPTEEKDIINLAEEMKLTVEEVKDTINDLHEVNPMLGHRGCRLAVTYPEIYRMQSRAIITAAINHKKEGRNIVPEIMIPLIGELKELLYVKNEIVEEINLVFEEANEKVDYLIGTMIEVPRAALLADEIAKEVDFFSFGTNDMTQMTFGFSRDDSGKFLNEYEDKKIYSRSPFEVLDQDGVGKLLEMAVDLGKKVNNNLHLGICGEHGGEPSSIEFCYKLGLDYVSCSPFRVPIARLTAAQATIKKNLG